MKYYIASCVFTSKFPELSFRIQKYVEERFGFPIVRCCVPKYKIKEFEEKMPEGWLRDSWSKLKDCGEYQEGDTIYSLCHNCNNIIEEMHPGVQVHSLWELIDQDETFVFPDYSGLKVTLQDCWRARHRKQEQDAVRSLLKKMNIEVEELAVNREDTMYCGHSLYREQPKRNPTLAPKFYVEGAKGLFVPHTTEEQEQLMKQHASQYKTDVVVCYCHYCLEGLDMAKVDGRHIAHMLFQ